jgi:hypothetical protein
VSGETPTLTGAGVRSFPPVAELATLSLALVIVGGIVMVATMFPTPAMAFPIVLLALSIALLVVNVVFLVRLKDFNWAAFSVVGRWALLAYAISGGMIEFTFLHNHVGGGPLVVLTLMIVMFVIDVPLIISFTVARYQTHD